MNVLPCELSRFLESTWTPSTGQGAVDLNLHTAADTCQPCCVWPAEDCLCRRMLSFYYHYYSLSLSLSQRHLQLPDESGPRHHGRRPLPANFAIKTASSPPPHPQPHHTTNTPSLSLVLLTRILQVFVCSLAETNKKRVGDYGVFHSLGRTKKSSFFPLFFVLCLFPQLLGHNLWRRSQDSQGMVC